MFARSLALLTVASLVAAQATELQLEYEQAQFQQSELVPDLLSSFDPKAVLDVSFGDDDASYGEALTIDQVSDQPTITVNPGTDDMSNFNSSSVFTLAMVDPGVVGADQSAGQTRHFLVNNVMLSGDSAPYSLNFTTEAITAYGGPYPADGSGPHRYTILLLPQPSDFQAPADLSTPGVAISTMDFPAYISETGLDQPVAGFYFTVEQGTTTSSIPATSSVVSTTLAAYGASTTAGVVTSAKSAASSLASVVSSAAAAASSSAADTSSASTTTSFGLAAVVGALGLVGASFL